MKRNQLDNYKSEIVKLYIDDKLPCEKIARIYGAHTCGIYDALRRWGIKTRNLSDSHKTYKIDDYFFDVIDSEEKAYWLGFFYADGYVTMPYSVGLALSSVDKEHIEKFLNSTNSDYPLHEYETNGEFGCNKYTRFLIKSKNMYQQLQLKGVSLRKSLILTYPSKEILPISLNRHFIRGYFDGDGSLILSKNSINFKICGTKEFLFEIIDILNKETDYDFKHRLFQRKNNDKNNYYLSYGGKNKTKEVMNYLYQDSNMYLDRKFNKYMILINS